MTWITRDFQRRLLGQFYDLNKRLDEIMSVLDDLKAKVELSVSVQESAILLLQGLSEKLRDAIAAGDPAALAELATKLDAEATALANAITVNTPAA